MSANFSGSHSHCNNNNNSGCESGWTLYFEESLEVEGRFRRSAVDYGGAGKEEGEGDLSMVSDASSGPRKGYKKYEESCESVRRNGKSAAAAKSKRKEEMGRRNYPHSCLDDTASSPVFGLSKRETNPYINEGFVENVKSKKQQDKKQMSFFQSSSAKKLGKNVSGDFEEEIWEQ